MGTGIPQPIPTGTVKLQEYFHICSFLHTRRHLVLGLPWICKILPKDCFLGQAEVEWGWCSKKRAVQVSSFPFLISLIGEITAHPFPICFYLLHHYLNLANCWFLSALLMVSFQIKLFFRKTTGSCQGLERSWYSGLIKGVFGGWVCASILPMNGEMQDQRMSLQTKQLHNARAETSFPAGGSHGQVL